MDAAPHSELDIVVERSGAFFQAMHPGGVLSEGSISHVTRQILRFLRHLMIEEGAGAPVVSAASVIVRGVRSLLIGGEGVARSALLLRLLEEGANVEGDGHVCLKRASVTAWPSALRIRAAATRFLPHLAPVLLKSPRLLDWHGEPIYSVVPSLDGRVWRVGSGRVQSVICLECNEGGRSVMGRLGRGLALRKFLAASMLPGSKGGAAASVATVLSTTHHFRLLLGDLEQALRQLTRGIGDGIGFRPLHTEGDES
jgi:hypothetical protein